MDSRLRTIFERLQRTRFVDLQGAHASVHLPVPERLLNDAIAEWLPRGGAVSEIRVRPHAGNRLDVQVKFARPAFLPPVNVTTIIERQPELPGSPEIVLRLSTLPGIMSLAGGAASFFNVLPPGVRMEGDRVVVNIAALARQHGLADELELVRRLHVTSEEGAVVLDLDAGIR